MNGLGIWIEREFRMRVAQKGFWIFTIIGMCMLILLSFLPSIFSAIQNRTNTTVLISDPKSIIVRQTENAVHKNSSAYDFQLKQVETGNMPRSQAGQFLHAHHASILVEVTGDTAAEAQFTIMQNGMVSSDTVSSIESLLQQTVSEIRISELPPSVQQEIVTPAPMKLVQLQHGAKSESQFGETAVLVYTLIVLLFASLATYGGWVAQGIVEEKSNRIVEMMLITSKPWHIFFGKVIGVGVVGLLQYVIWMIAIGIILVIKKPFQNLSITHVPVETIVLFPIFFILGYVTWALLFGISGALVHRVEEQQMSITPVILTMLIGFYTTIFGIIPNPGTSFARIVSFIPLYSPLTMYTRAAMTAVPAWQIAVAAILDIAAAAGLVALGAKTYRKFALRTSGPSGWKAFMKKGQATSM